MLPDINITKLFDKYSQKYPLYQKETLIDLMLKDGIISNDIAKQLKNGKSCFYFTLENKFLENNVTEIFGGYFSKKTPKTNFNSKIEPTFQSEKQGDCWLLSDINHEPFLRIMQKILLKEHIAHSMIFLFL